ncbi:hypothetical protein [Paractinoplanes toevensis]|uniref:Uncharacterized protein n=1 Tax=Paractinoplanes toevensis TaxID=571911 RepID=A0A919T6E8_9ACTN|nr:hypothetical protein [Actinoplanes toevensis]GIM88861.1 hypothetical protein Ato02nite_006540 [Actinoplanes toevensis]
MTTLPTDVVRMVLAGDRRRATRANTALSVLSRYERRLVREAAVMGYVLGRQDGYIKARQGASTSDSGGYPKDSAILQDVIEHCDSTSDRFPYLAAACAGQRRRVTRARLWAGEETER